MDGYSISQVAERTGFSASTLRFYEQSGLVTPNRTPSGYRTYDDHHLELLSFVGRAKGLGLSLDEIVEVLELRAQNRCAPVQEGSPPPSRSTPPTARATTTAAAQPNLVALTRPAGRATTTTACARPPVAGRSWRRHASPAAPHRSSPHSASPSASPPPLASSWASQRP
jgi:DNA-binding transcriptional MerR regulator